MKVWKILAVLALLITAIFWKLHAAGNDSPLAYHLATNTLARAGNLKGSLEDQSEIVAPSATNACQLERLTNAVWSQKFWLKNVSGLSATPIGFTNVLGGQGLPTMVSPRHYLAAIHMHCEGYKIAFLDTNNVVHFRTVLERIEVTNDTCVGILDRDLPPSVGFLPVLPENFADYLPTSPTSIVQGIGMNQGFYLFSQPLNFGNPQMVMWNSTLNVPDGLTTNWTYMLHAGDSSNPVMILVGNQLVLVSHNYFIGGGPNYAKMIPALNAAMHQLSKKHRAGSDYQLTEFPLTNWLKI